jgi:hypothetical protein
MISIANHTISERLTMRPYSGSLHLACAVADAAERGVAERQLSAPELDTSADSTIRGMEQPMLDTERIASILAVLMVVQALLGLLRPDEYRDVAWIKTTWYGND